MLPRSYKAIERSRVEGGRPESASSRLRLPRERPRRPVDVVVLREGAALRSSVQRAVRSCVLDQKGSAQARSRAADPSLISVHMPSRRRSSSSAGSHVS